jgi:hypothetical protein
VSSCTHPSIHPEEKEKYNFSMSFFFLDTKGKKNKEEEVGRGRLVETATPAGAAASDVGHGVTGRS